jgi:hypothetical protein
MTTVASAAGRVPLLGGARWGANYTAGYNARSIRMSLCGSEPN